MSYDVNWISRIQETVDEDFDMHVPPDIIFKIVENGSTYEIQAHKMVMGMASPVFNRMLFVAETSDKDAKEILVKETTVQAFEIMKEALYNIKLIKDSLKGKSVDEVFAVLNLVTRYKISELVNSVKEYISNFPLTDENVLEVAEDSMHYTETFGDEANALLAACAKFVEKKFTDGQTGSYVSVQLVFQYAAQNEDRGEVLFKLMVLMNHLKCSNCLQEVCMDGKGVGENQFRVGLVVTNDRDRYWGLKNWGTGRVNKIEGDLVFIKTIIPGEELSFKNDWFNKLISEKPTFLFSCK